MYFTCTILMKNFYIRCYHLSTADTILNVRMCSLLFAGVIAVLYCHIHDWLLMNIQITLFNAIYNHLQLWHLQKLILECLASKTVVLFLYFKIMITLSLAFHFASFFSLSPISVSIFISAKIFFQTCYHPSYMKFS